MPEGAGFELVSCRVQCSGRVGSVGNVSGIGAVLVHSRGPAHCTGWPGPPGGPRPVLVMPGDRQRVVVAGTQPCWSSRKNASHHVGFVIRVLTPQPWHWGLSGCTQVPRLFWRSLISEPRAPLVRKSGQVISAQSYCHPQYFNFFSLLQNQNASKRQAFSVANDRECDLLCHIK